MDKLSPETSVHSQSTLHSNYRKTVLPSGIRVVTEEIPYVRSVSVGVWIEVGSRDEDSRTNGISHFLEHMVFKGTKRYSAQKIAHSLESVGGYLNAFTTKEHTCFYARILDADLERAVDVISDLVQYPVFKAKDMEKEKGVILEEMKNIEDDPDDLIHDYFDRSIFFNHPLGYPIIGNAENVRSFQKEDLTNYISRYYTPHRMVVAAAGNLQHEKVTKLVEKYFKPTARKSERNGRIAGPKKMYPKNEVFEKPITQAHVCLGTISYGVRSKLRYPLLLLNSILGEGMSSRLFQNIREKYGFAYSVYSFANLMSDTGNFGVYVGTDEQNIHNSIELIHKELEKLYTRPIALSELRRAKAQLKGSMMLSLESMSNRMMRLGSGELYYGDYIPLDEVLRKVEVIEVDSLSELAAKLFKRENFSTVTIRPQQGKGKNGQPS